MAKYCLIPKIADKFKQAIIDGRINPDRLVEMTSKQRRELFDKLLGVDNGSNVNALFEKRILQKNREEAIVKWAKELTGITEQSRRDILSKIDRIVKKSPELLNPENEGKFMEDLVRTKLGANVSFEEAKKITELSKSVDEKKSFLDKNPTSEKSQTEYGMARLDMMEYLSELKRTDKLTIKDTFMNALGMQRAIQLGIDLGTTLIQGAGLITEKSSWKANFQGLKNMISKEEERLMKARIMGHPNYEAAMKAGLRLPLYGTELFKKEEAAMFNKLKVVTESKFGKAATASLNETIGFFERYVSALSQSRFDVFNQMLETSRSAGIDVSAGSKELKDIANAVNTISGSASLGRFERNTAEANIVFMSARLLVSKFKNIFSPIQIGGHYARKALGKETKYSDTIIKKKMRTFIGITGVSSSLLSLFALSGYDVETDPRSSNFAKAKVGDRYVDLSLGYGSFLTFLAREISGQTKSSETGIVKRIREDFTFGDETQPRATDQYGSPITSGSVIASFFRNKLAAFPGLITDYFTENTVIGKEVSLSQEAKDRIPPMFISDFWNIVSDDKTGTLEKALVSTISLIGAGGYTKTPYEWDAEKKVMSQFKKQVGEEKFKQANDEFNTLSEKKLKSMKNNKTFQEMTEIDKQRAITTEKNIIKKQIFQKYGFRYVQERKAPLPRF